MYLSVNTGVSTDAFIEEHIWSLNLEAIKDFFGHNNNGYTKLSESDILGGRFYGIGFNFLSQIYILAATLVVKFEGLSFEISKVLLKHNLIFCSFFLSAIFSKKILNLIIKNNFYSNLFLVFYLFYPFLLGHGFYNPKDMPLLFAWILSSYFSFKIFLKLYNDEKIYFMDIFLIALSTAFLISIRITGILIFFQYFITFLITVRFLKFSFFEFFKSFFYKIFLFFLLTIVFVIIFYPLFWKNPLLIFDSIIQAKKIQFGICTLTLGKCMDGMDLPSSYIFIWFFFKMPLISLIGLFIFPFIEKRIFIRHDNQIILGSIFLTLLFIIFILIFFKVNLYDELRHILFLMPLLLISSFSVIYFFSKKITLYLVLISVLIFSFQNIKMYPYQYTYFNQLSNFIDINNNFELDYWGISGRNIAKRINKNKQLLSNKDKCIYVAPVHIIKHFISSEYKCVKPFLSIYPKSSEKYILIKYTRNIRRENPSNCKLIFEESYNLSSFNNNLKMGEVFICN